jgi:hypothetical protein
METISTQTAGGVRGLIADLNGRWHRPALAMYMFVVLAHWAEHVAQAIQIWLLDWPVPKARGVLGQNWHWLVHSETLHAGYAVFMFAGLALLAPGFAGSSRKWWMLAFYIQAWHLFEHLLLFGQAQTDLHLAGKPVPTSVLQLVFPRVELHLVYNGLVTIPMIVAVVQHMRTKEGVTLRCNCSLRQPRVEPAVA